MRTAVLMLLGMLAPAQGAPLLELMGTPTPDLPFGGPSAVRDGSAAYFNPARLSVKKRTVSVSYLANMHQVSISLNPRPMGYDVPDSVYQAKQVVNGRPEPLSFRPRPSSQLDRKTQYGEDKVLGQNVILTLSTPLIDDRVSIGMTSIFSLGALQRLRPSYPDERAQFFDGELHPELLGDRLVVTTFILGMAFQPSKYLSFGLGVTMLNDSQSVPEVYIPDASDQENALLSPEIDVTPIFTPHFGVVYRPMGRNDFELSSSVHLASQSTMTGQSELTFWKFEYPDGQDSLNQPFNFTFLHEPLRVSFGTLYDWSLSDGSHVEFYGQLKWAQWSQYTDRVGHTPRDWADVLSAQLGTRWQSQAHSIGLGFGYTPSPVPEQTGRTNYVDNTRIGTQLGYAWRYKTPQGTIGLGFCVQGQYLTSRQHWKNPNARDPVVDEFPDAVDLTTGQSIPESSGLQTNNPGFPGFEHHGFILSAGVTVTFEKGAEK